MIGYAEQRGSLVYVYNTNGGLLWTNHGELQGYTASTVVIRRGSITFVYGERGELKFTR